jgi:predicted RNA-binding Zn ribbon-like protein
LVDVTGARRALGDAGLPVDCLTQEDLLRLDLLAGAVSEVGDSLALGGPPAARAVDAINELASGCAGTARLSVSGQVLRSDVDWRDPDPVAALARRIVEELGAVDASRVRRCERGECDLLFLDSTRSRSQRWHAENPCGWLARQRRRRISGRSPSA